MWLNDKRRLNYKGLEDLKANWQIPVGLLLKTAKVCILASESTCNLDVKTKICRLHEWSINGAKGFSL